MSAHLAGNKIRIIQAHTPYVQDIHLIAVGANAATDKQSKRNKKKNKDDHSVDCIKWILNNCIREANAFVFFCGEYCSNAFVLD
ncbi:uncharacterized protein MEPE_04619 [Melanopsichium pennsylvanicum]|uniref:Uncharacterized protein n=1 Tax=Melanopsichium pennsylvanicum TaxID=63383 RepID=A0AAJ4XNK2_9BASI|nr:uncharacterized protein MEPE_04619 [Melanopsichium pennsylvanicum]